jgi:thiamine kinase-like enzyme
MSLADLRKELKEMRKSAMPTPVSRMKKTDVARELERLKGLHHKEEKKVESVMEKADVPKKVVEKVKKVQDKEHEEQKKVVKKVVRTVVVKKDDGEMKPTKFIKGSEEARAHMAKLREMRKKKSDE